MIQLIDRLKLWRTDAAQRKNTLFWSGIFALLWIACHYVPGFLLGFSRTGISAAPGLLAVCLFCGLLRWTAVSLLVRTGLNRWGIGVLCTLILAALALCLTGGLQGAALFSFQGLVGRVLPALSQSALVTALLFCGGMAPALLYVLAARFLPALIPVSAAVSSTVTAMVELLLPMIFLIALDCVMGRDENEENEGNEGKDEKEENKADKKGHSLAWLAFAVPLVLLMTFFLGLLPWRPLAVATGSMEPNISVGDMVICAQAGGEDLEVGDVMVFYRDGEIVVHRIVGIAEETTGPVYTTRGDANNADDADPVPAEDVIGRVILVVPKLGRLSLWMRGG